MGPGGIAFLLIGLAIWMISKYMQKAWNVPVDSSETDDTDDSYIKTEEYGMTKPPLPYTYEDPLAEHNYSKMPIPDMFSYENIIDSDIQAKINSYNYELTKSSSNVTNNEVFVLRKTETTKKHRSKVKFDLRQAVIYNTILNRSNLNDL